MHQPRKERLLKRVVLTFLLFLEMRMYVYFSNDNNSLNVNTKKRAVFVTIIVHKTDDEVIGADESHSVEYSSLHSFGWSGTRGYVVWYDKVVTIVEIFCVCFILFLPLVIFVSLLFSVSRHFYFGRRLSTLFSHRTLRVPTGAEFVLAVVLIHSRKCGKSV